MNSQLLDGTRIKLRLTVQHDCLLPGQSILLSGIIMEGKRKLGGKNFAFSLVVRIDTAAQRFTAAFQNIIFRFQLIPQLRGIGNALCTVRTLK